jgi:hypothetical protein
MKKIFLTLAIALSLTLGFSSNTVFSSVQNQTTEATTGYIYVKVYEDGAIWVYVYTEDGTFVSKMIEQQM